MADAAPEPQIILASSSPRRSLLLALIGVRSDVVSPDLDEEAVAGTLDPLAATVAVATAKVDVIADSARPVLGADTVVVCDNQVLGKPRDRNHAVEMLHRMRDQDVEVISAVALRHPDGRVDHRVAVSVLHMRPIDATTIQAYVETGEADDKAGALSVQGRAKDFVDLRSGSRSNVFGLPLPETIELLTAAGIDVDTPKARQADGRDLFHPEP